MFRQFDVIVVFDKIESGNIPEPSFTDPSLGWFFTDDINDALSKTEAEWIVIARESVNVTRDFLNNLAECNCSFPMADALAPRIRTAEGRFKSGRVLNKKGDFVEISELSKMRYVAAPHPSIAAYSRRIIQRTGTVDTSFPWEFQFVDYSLRMLHAGGHLFSIPYLVIDENPSKTEEALDIKESNDACIKALYKSFGLWEAFKFAMRHPSSISSLFKNRKQLAKLRRAATDLSKMTEKMRSDILGNP